MLRLGRMDSIENLLVFPGPRSRLGRDKVSVRSTGGGDRRGRGPPGAVAGRSARCDNRNIAHQNIPSPTGGTERGPTREQRAPLA